MIDNTSSQILDSSVAIEDISGTISSSITFGNATTPLIVSGYSNFMYADTSAAWDLPNYYSTLSSLPKFYSSEELLSKIKSILDSYGFEFTYNSDDSVVNNSSLSEKETSSNILGWVAVGFLENKSYFSNFRLLLRYATDKFPTSITLIVKEGSYFENFSIKILLENNLVLIDSTSGIVHIIQEMLLENLQKAIDEIIEDSTPAMTVGGQGTTSLGYWNGISSVDTAISTVLTNNPGISY